MGYVPCRELQKLTLNQQQICPLCGELQTIMMRGKTVDFEDGVIGVVGDRGYSFCNCRNIFFTDWNNIKLNHYDESYIDRTGGEGTESKTRILEIEKQWEIVNQIIPKAKSLLNVGDYEDTFIDYLAKNNWNNMSFATIDIIPRKSRHRLITENFEDYETDEKFDIIWMSHFIEHTRNPKNAILKAKSMLTPNGIIFNAMPDTQHIDWSNPLEWCWMVQEHHILWNMYDWIDFLSEECGLKCLYKNLSFDVLTKGNNKEMYWIKESRTIFQKQE